MLFRAVFAYHSMFVKRLYKAVSAHQSLQTVVISSVNPHNYSNCKFLGRKYSTDVDSSTASRLVNPDEIDNKGYVASLCMSLHSQQPERYRFLLALAQKKSSSIQTNSNADSRSSELISLSENLPASRSSAESELEELLKVFGQEGVEQKCLEKFQSWADKSKLNIAYALYANDLHCDEFMKRLVRHLSPQVDNLMPEDLVALLMIIYLQKSWTPDELYDVLDPTSLQLQLANYIKQGVLSNSEICAACHGLKKIESFIVKEDLLRSALYEKMLRIAAEIKKNQAASALDCMTLLHVMVLLHQGSLVTFDSSVWINQVLEAYAPIAKFLDSRTAVKMMTFATVKNIHNPQLTRAVLERLMSEQLISQLSLRDICGLLKFVVFIDLHEVFDLETCSNLVEIIVTEINSIRDENVTITDVGQLLQAWSYLSQLMFFDEVRLQVVFQAINNSITVELAREMSDDELSRASVSQAYESLFPESFQKAKETTHELPSNVIKSFVRNISSLDQTLAVFKPKLSSEIGLRQDVVRRLLKVNQSPVPVEVHSTRAKNQNLSRRQKTFFSVLNEIQKVMGDDYVRLVHVLPHFQEPDIVFGHLSGVKMSIPESMSSSLDLKPAPSYGEWFVISWEMKFSTEKSKKVSPEFNPFLNDTIAYNFGSLAEPFRFRQLRTMGYNVIPITEAVQKGHIRKWVNKVLASSMSGLEQDTPSKKTIPPM